MFSEMYRIPTQLVQRLCWTTARRQSVLTQQCCSCSRPGTTSLQQSNLKVYHTTSSCNYSSTPVSNDDPAKAKNNSANDQAQIDESSQDISSTSAEKLLQDSQVLDIEPEFPSDVANKWGEYNNYNDWARSQSRHAFRPRIDPKQMSIVIFPGQGAQFVGMASKLIDYPNVVEMFNVASEVLKYDLLDVCLNGPKEKLDKTIHCQPAVMVTSLAAIEKLKDEKPWVGSECLCLFNTIFIVKVTCSRTLLPCLQFVCVKLLVITYSCKHLSNQDRE